MGYSVVVYTRFGTFEPMTERNLTLKQAHSFIDEELGGAKAIGNPRIPCQPDYAWAGEMGDLLVYIVY